MNVTCKAIKLCIMWSPDHHELLQLVQRVVVSAALQELAGGDEVAAAGLQAGVQLLQDALQR